MDLMDGLGIAGAGMLPNRVGLTTTRASALAPGGPDSVPYSNSKSSQYGGACTPVEQCKISHNSFRLYFHIIRVIDS